MQPLLVASGIVAIAVIASAAMVATNPSLSNAITASAQTVQSVFVTNTNTKPVPTACPPAKIQHWDKIVFTVPFQVPGKPPLVSTRTYDIKVLDDPTQVADLNQKVFDFLKSKGYTDISATQIRIVDVEYAIVCRN